jgi:tetratricopeptide (TPR) repeat protein
MDHPNIARVLDGGTIGNPKSEIRNPNQPVSDLGFRASDLLAGRPFFVMELVKGVPITKYCDEHRLTPRQRLELFVAVCRAVQHAHQKGIIHRDLKPSNILVAQYDGRPVPKVIDFGVAKAVGQQLTDKTLMTGFGTMVGTLEYMSPEQAEVNQLDIDTRSDIYSLGVVLYELLTGSTPLERSRLKATPLLNVLQAIREEEPPKPSTRLAASRDTLPSISAQRQTEPAKLTKLVRGELDWIVMKALEKDRNRRYETANGFALDLQRYLADEPIQASPPSATYRLRKFVRRNKGAVLGVSAIVLALAVGIMGTTTGLVRALAAERQAITDRDQKEEALDEKDEALKKVVTERDEKEKARRQAETERDEKEKARQKAAQERERARQALNTMTDEMMEDLLGRQVRLTDRHREFLKKTLAFHEAFAAASADDVESRTSRAAGYFRVGLIRQRLGELKAAESAYRESLDINKKLAKQFSNQVEYRHGWAICENNLGLVLRDMGRLPKAEQAYREALRLREQMADDFKDRPDFRYLLASNYRNLGVLLFDTGQLEEADTLFGKALAITEKLGTQFRKNPEYREESSIVHQRLCPLLVALGRPDEAEKSCRAALDIASQLADDFRDQPRYRQLAASGHHNLGNLLRDRGKYSEAEIEFLAGQRVYKQLAAAYPNRPEYRRELAVSHNNLGNLLSLLKRPEAEDALRTAFALARQLVADYPDRPDFENALADCQSSLGSLFLLTKRDKEAEEAFQAVLALRKKLAEENRDRPEFRRYLALAYRNLGASQHDSKGPKVALDAFHQALQIYQKLAAAFPGVPDYEDDLGLTFLQLAAVHILKQEHAESVKYLEQAVAHVRAAVKASPKNRSYRQHYRQCLDFLANGYVQLADHERLARVADEVAGSGVDPAKDNFAAALHFNVCIGLNAQDKRLSQARREELARGYATRMQALLREAVRLGNKDAGQLYKVWRDNLKKMAKTQLDQADYAWLARTANDLSWWGYDPPNDTYDAACFLCHCATLVEKDNKLDEAKRAEFAKSYADKAMELLQQAVARGYKDAAHMKKDPDLEPLRAREDFKKLLASLEKKSKD